MRLSVLVTSYESPESLRSCLESLTRQPLADEILVADASERDPSTTLARFFPSVRFLHLPDLVTVPALRWAALRRSSGEIVAAVESRCVPAADWCETILAAHERNPDAPAIGGPVGIMQGASTFDLGLYFSEYGLFVPPAAEGPARRLSGANLSYKREALERARDLLDAGAWETLLHERWLREGRRLLLCSAEVAFHNTMRPAKALLQRFHYGRGYAADRIAGRSFAVRPFFAAATVLLPFLLTARSASHARRSPWRGRFLRALPWLILMNLFWSAGELAGYVTGEPGSPRNF